jgi:hypothetical protein
MMEQVFTGRGSTQEREEDVVEGKGHERVNVVKILCTHVCKWKNDIC